MIKKVSSKFTKGVLLSLGITSVFSSLLLIYTPIAGAFGEITVDCKNGGTVSCNGSVCTGNENTGCSCKDASGKVTEKHSCPKAGGIQPVEDAY